MADLHECVQVGGAPRAVGGRVGVFAGAVHEHHIGDDLAAPTRLAEQRGAVAAVMVVPADTERTVAVEGVVLDRADDVLAVSPMLDDSPASHILVSKLSHRIVTSLQVGL